MQVPDIFATVCSAAVSASIEALSVICLLAHFPVCTKHYYHAREVRSCALIPLVPSMRTECELVNCQDDRGSKQA